MNKQRPVLCISLHALHLATSLPKVGERKLIPFNFAQEIQPIDLDIMDRNIVDSSEALHFSEGMKYPQLLPYVVIRYNDQILTYSRAKGAEARLHGTRSIGFGGHMDMSRIPEDIAESLQQECAREVQEEVGINLTDFNFTHIISDYSNAVGSVHLGILTIVDLTEDQFADINVDNTEISDPEWVSLFTLKHDYPDYENWSQMVINHLIGERRSCLKSSV